MSLRDGPIFSHFSVGYSGSRAGPTTHPLYVIPDTGSSSVLAVIRRFSRLEDAVDRQNCSLPALLNQSCKDIDLFVTDSSRNSFNIHSDD